MVEGLYIHIPFCDTICTYCDFYKMRAKEEVKDNYITTVIDELMMKTEYMQDLKTIYIGGGTPSSLSLFTLEKLLQALTNVISIEDVKEFTIEANPNDITDDFVALIMKYKVNRISLGVQSFYPSKQKVLGRIHTKEDCINALTILHDHGFENVNVDLIYGIEADSFAILKKDILLAKSLHVTHFSVYSLILEERTMLYHLYMKDEFHPMEDDKVANLYEKLQHLMKEVGFLQYEISNFSLPGYESLHNLLYWDNLEYMGLGTASSYYYNHTRYKNIAHLERYTAGVQNQQLIYQEEEKLSQRKELEIALMMGLRKVRGIHLPTFLKQYNITFFDAFSNAQNLIQDGLLIFEQDSIRIPEDKLFLSNAIIVKLL